MKLEEVILNFQLHAQTSPDQRIQQEVLGWKTSPTYSYIHAHCFGHWVTVTVFHATGSCISSMPLESLENASEVRVLYQAHLSILSEATISRLLSEIALEFENGPAYKQGMHYGRKSMCCRVVNVLSVLVARSYLTRSASVLVNVVFSLRM